MHYQTTSISPSSIPLSTLTHQTSHGRCVTASRAAIRVIGHRLPRCCGAVFATVTRCAEFSTGAHPRPRVRQLYCRR
jgi:hypothetical protein